MPVLTSLIPEQATHIIDPITSQVVASVIQRLGLNPYFNAEMGNIYIHTQRSAASVVTDGRGQLSLENKTRCDVTVEENYDPDSVFWTTGNTYSNISYGISPYFSAKHPKVLVDKDAAMYISETSVPCGLTLTFTMNFATDEGARRAFSSIKAQNHGTVVSDTHDLVYDYPLSRKILEVLFSVYKVKTSINSEISFIDYIKKIQSSAAVRIDVKRPDCSNPNRKSPQKEIVLKRTQLYTAALLEFSQQYAESIKFNQLPSSFPITFTYKIQFGRPDSLTVVLPTVVENQVVNPALFKSTPNEFLLEVEGKYEDRDFDAIYRYLHGPNSDKMLIRFPSYDDYNVPSSSKLHKFGYQPFLIACFTLDLPGKTYLPVSEIYGTELHPIVVHFIKLMGDEVFGYEGLFNISVFGDNIAVDPSNLSLDTDTMTVAVDVVVPHLRYHYVISEAQNFQRVHPKWYPELLKYRYFFPLTIMKNLSYFLRMGIYSISVDDGVTKLINQLMKNGRFKSVVNEMVGSGEATPEIYQYIATANQFADYITETRSNNVTLTLNEVMTQSFPSDVIPDNSGSSVKIIEYSYDDTVTYGRTLFDCFTDICLKRNYIPNKLNMQSHLRTPKGYPYGPEQGGFNGFTVPLRVLNFTVSQGRHDATGVS